MSQKSRKPVRLKNRTNYFDPSKDKSHVSFTSPDSFSARTTKIEGYEARLYWEFRYCLDNDGQTFFVTLTYCDRAMPKYQGRNCFDYNDLVYILNGAFKKRLLRDYGTNFKYFVGAELGEGAGSRGMENNPHYHLLLFTRSANSKKYPYKRISSEDMLHWIKIYWQGFDDNLEFVDYRKCKYGIVKEGKYGIVVKDFRACKYVSKYVTKDSGLVKYERHLARDLRLTYSENLKGVPEVLESFYKDIVTPLYNVPKKAHIGTDHDDWQFTPIQVFESVAPNHYRSLVDFVVPLGSDISDHVNIPLITNAIIEECDMQSSFNEYFEKYVEDKVKKDISEYRNRYCNKCRISQGVGDYALSFIDNPLDPFIPVPDSTDGWRNRPLSMYYYRKLFTKVVKDQLGNNIRVLTDLGIKYKLSRLSSQIDKLVNKTRAELSCLDSYMYDKIVSSDLNTSVGFGYNKFSEIFSFYDVNIVLQRYAEFKLVYEDRFFAIPSVGLDTSLDLDVFGDYQRFLRPSVYSVDYSPNRLNLFLETDYQGFIPYLSHPYFLEFNRLFAVFDLLSDYLFVNMDKASEDEDRFKRDVRKFHDLRALNKYYSQFNI